MSPALSLLRCALCALLALSSLTALPQCWKDPKKLVPTKAFNTAEGFGRSIDYEDNIAVVGAPSSDTLRSSSGVVYIFEFKNGNWKKIASLTASDHRENQGFGRLVLIQNDRIFVADASRNNGGGNYGAVYIYEKPAAGWHDMVETSILMPTYPYPYQFAVSMDISGNKLLVGAPTTVNASNINAGAAFLFELQGNTFTQKATFKSPHPRMSRFGSNVALAENMAVVVAEEETRPTYTAIGATYVFEKNAGAPWTDAYPVARLTESSGNESIAYLGQGLCIDESRNTIFVTRTIWVSTTGYRAIEVYQKPAAGWADMTETHAYLGSGASQVFSQTLRFAEPYLYSGAGPQVEIFTPDNHNEWRMTAPAGTLVNSDFHLQKQFGTGLCVSGDRVLVSAPARVTQDREMPIAPASPAVYDFIRPAAGWQAGNNVESHSFVYMPITATDYFFGYDVDIDGDIAIVASPYDNVDRTGAGAVYVYRLENYQWNKIAILTQSDGEPYDNFGRSLSISGDYIAIGSSSKDYRDETGKLVDFSLGAVYIFKKPASGWTSTHESYKIIHSEGKIDWNLADESEDDYFGLKIDMDYPYLAVGRYNQGSRPNTGSVFVFNLTGDNAVLEATLTPSFRDQVNNFGNSICIRDSVIAISGGTARAWMFDRNYVFMYKKTGDKWKNATESAILVPSDNGSTGYLPGIAFGHSLDMTDDGSEIIVGAPGWFDGIIFTTTDLFKGAAYIYEKPQKGWTGVIKEKAKLTVPNQPAYGCMGASVHIEGRYAMVGSPQNYWSTTTQNPGPGRVYFYQKPADGWTYKLPDVTIQGDESGSALSDYFGSSVAGVAGYVMIGAIADDNQNNVDAGSVYVYTEYPFLDPLQGMVCENAGNVQLTAIPAGGVWAGSGITTEGIFDPVLAGSGPHTISYAVGGCAVTSTLQIQVAPAPDLTTFMESDSLYFCGKATVRLETKQNHEFGYGWSYSENDGPYNPIGTNTAVMEADKPGYYKVAVTGGCSAASATVWVGDASPHGGPDFSACAGDSPYQLTGNYSLGTWSGQGISPTGLFDPKTLNAGVYELLYTVSPSSGCDYKDAVQVRVSRLQPQISPAFDSVSFCAGQSVALSVASIPEARYTWIQYVNNTPEVVRESIGSFSETIRESGKFKLQVESDGCIFESTDMVTWEVPGDSVFVPNVFTPNGDRTNDNFEIHVEGADQYYIHVFNRLGKEVWSGQQGSPPWNAADTSAGVYFWVLSYDSSCSSRKEYKGWVQVLK